LSLIKFFLGITLARITPHTGSKCEKKKKTMIKSAQATLGGIKENSQPSKVPKQSWGHEEKSKRSKNSEHKKKSNTMILKTN
jgi:hypothetical protein